MPIIEQRLSELGITLPVPPAPVASYVPYTISGKLVVISGQIPLENGKPHYIGKLGADISLEDGHAAPVLNRDLCQLECHRLPVARNPAKRTQRAYPRCAAGANAEYRISNKEA